jgi:hypothetical protein
MPAWVRTQDRSEIVEVVSIQLSCPIGIDLEYNPFGLVGICLNKQLHNLGIYSTRERAEKELLNFSVWLKNGAVGVFPFKED